MKAAMLEELDPDLLRTDASRNHAVYGTFGVSVLALRDATLDELAQQAPLVRFERLAAHDRGRDSSCRASAGATGRNPRYFDVTFDDLEDGVARLCRCEHKVVVNPYHEP